MGTKNSKRNEGRQEKNGGVKGRCGSADELDKLPNTAAEFREEGRRRRGRPRLRWEDYAKRDVRKAGEEEYWKKNTRDKGWWKRLSDNAVKKLRAAPRPMTKGKIRDISLLLI